MITPAHLANLSVHVAAGTGALALGFTILARGKGTASHRRMGRIFCYLALVVSLSAATGLVLFRFLPLFAVLTVLVLYQVVGGWRVARTQESGPAPLDGLWTLFAAIASTALVPILLGRTEGATVVVRSTLGALASVLAYDTVRWTFPRSWHGVVWRYEHAYKLNAALFGMLSALVGNVVRVGHPWSQIAPSAIGLLTIAYLFRQLYREDRRARCAKVEE